ncbi:MAG: Gfo/Idh/MocA family oxidoreductase [Planctomycetes bacterium]|nr:Gfo/Idh/MocA family oxidoreductase [Planctomycetota bacterium]
MESEGETVSRRDFLRNTAAGAVAGMPLFMKAAEPRRRLKIGLIGCGGRGNGALNEAMRAAEILGYDVKVAALADYFKDRAERTGKRYDVPATRCFGGPTAYKDLLATDVEIVLNITAPLFRPLHLEACIEAGKHAFIEKPVAVDPPGCRRIIAAGEAAKNKGLVVMAGTEMRHDWQFIETHRAVAIDGALGKLYAGRIAFCIGHMFRRAPIRPKTAEDLIASWQNWIALSGDHLVEQHVHNIDIANWFAGRPPASAVGFGGRARRPAGDMYDFFSIDYDYGGKVHIHSMCRQVNGCWGWTGHEFIYEKGTTDGRRGPTPGAFAHPDGLPRAPSSAVQEQVDMLFHVAHGIPVDQARAVAESTATAILGRISAYTGAQVTWAEIMGDPRKNPALYDLTLRPTAEDFEKGTVEMPEENVIPVPGQPA